MLLAVHGLPLCFRDIRELPSPRHPSSM
jgi:hypothetical protein